MLDQKDSELSKFGELNSFVLWMWIAMFWQDNYSKKVTETYARVGRT